MTPSFFAYPCRSFANTNGRVIVRGLSKLEPVSLCLAFKDFKARKLDYKALCVYLIDLCTYWGFNGKHDVILWTPDSEAAGKKALRCLDWAFWVCDCHQINRAVLYGLGITGPEDESMNKEGKELVLSLKKMTSHFSHSIKVTGDLQAMEKQLGLRKTLRMVRPGATRWNGVHDMARRSNTLEMPLRQLADGRIPKSRVAVHDAEDDYASKLEATEDVSDHESDSDVPDAELLGNAVVVAGQDADADADAEVDASHSENEDAAGWCLSSAEFKLSRQFEGCLVQARQSTDILQQGPKKLITGQILLVHKTLIDMYEEGPDELTGIPKSSAASLVPEKERAWKLKKNGRLEPAAQTLRKVIGEQLRQRWIGKPSALVEQPEAFKLAAFMDRSVPNKTVFSNSELSRVRATYRKKIKDIIIRRGGATESAPRQLSQSESDTAAASVAMPSFFQSLTQQMAGMDRGQPTNSTMGGAETAAAREIRLWNQIPMRQGLSVLESMEGQPGIDAHVSLACSVFSAQAVEAGSERVFSHAGRLLSPLRESMGSEMAKNFIFLHENIQFWPTVREIMMEYWAEHYPGVTVPYHCLD